MTDHQQIEVFEEHGDAHAGDRYKGRIEECENSADQSLDHTPSGTSGVEVNRNSRNNMFPILMT